MEEQDYTVAELIHNDSFRRIIDGTASTEEKEYWNRWMEASEVNRQKVQQAMSEIAGFKFAKPVESDKERQWERLYNKTIKNKDKYKRKTSNNSARVQWMFRAVAAVLLIAVVGIGVYYYEISNQSTELAQISKRESVSTNAGQQKILRFTNGDKEAKIVMNGNSTITYDVGLLENEPINVELHGEAFFDVEKGFAESPPAFSVTTPDGVIEDIGTEFMVTVDPNLSRVVLQEGMVNVQAMNGTTVVQDFDVARGEMIEFTSQEILTKSKVNSSFYTSWATGQVEFDQTKISAFARFIESRYGATVKIVDPDLADATIDGAAYFRSLEELARSVSDVMEIPVFQSASGDTIFIGRQYGG
ncbi:FecR family protein [Halalkalibaculum sp. DA3122]|uniref:FecR family protein n=1 Tax=Halalkalibaculum sp. DA3122 TaxID=3373607 RepID=UPI003754A8B4